MAQYGKNNYFDGVILPEPKEEMLRRMAQGVDASKGYLESTDAGLLFDGPRSMECFFNLRQSDGTQRPAQFSTSMLAIAVTPMDAIMFHCGNKSLQVSRATIGDDIHAVISYKYRWEASESNIGNIRFYPNYEGSGVTSYLEDNANGFTGRYAHIISGSSGLLSVYSYRFMGHPVGCVVEAKFKYRSNAPVRVLEGNRILPINMEDAADATIVYRTTGTNISGFSVTVPNADANSWVEIQPVSLRTLGCVAEYLPQNLIPTAESYVVQWLDSAPQLPEANGILPPLDASVGGYDLAAIGNPKIVV